MTLPAPAFDILYAEDFGAPDDPAPPEPVAMEPEAPPITTDDVSAACATAVQAARDEWEASALEARTRGLAVLAAEIASVRTEARQQAEQVAEATAQAVLSMLAGLLPDLCARHGDAEVRALARHFLPTLRLEPRVTIRVHAGLVADLQADVALLDEELAARVQVLPAPLPPGDLRVTWADGGMVRDGRAILAAMQETLGQLGLLSATPNPSQNRSMAHAD